MFHIEPTLKTGYQFWQWGKQLHPPFKSNGLGHET